MTAGSTHRATQENGPSVVGGRLIWTSATGITSADTGSYGGCLRRWYYEQVENRQGPPTAAMMGGTDLHNEIEGYLKSGARLMSPLALSGRRFIPQPGSNLHIERPIHFKTRGGVSIFGHVDLYNFRQEYIDPDGDLQSDPPWSFEVRDWKTTSDFQYAKTKEELADNIQLVTYAEAGFRFMPDLEHARLTHVYFRTRGRPESRLVTVRRTREEIMLRWAYAETVIDKMSEAAGAPTANHVPGNRKACDAYRGCPHREYCGEYRRTSLDDLYSDKIANDWNERTMPVGLLANNPQLMNPAPDMRAQLAEEEARMRAQVAQQQQQMPRPATNTAQLADVCTRLGSYGFGMPSLAGAAAQAYAQMGGQAVPPGFVYQGIASPPGAKRSLHSLQLTEVAHIFQLESELAEERAAAQPSVNQTPTMQAPAPQPAAHALDRPASAPVYTGILPPGAPESSPMLATAQPKPETTEYALGSEPAATPAKKTRGRPKKDALDPAPEVAVASAAQTAASPNPPSVPVTPMGEATQVTPAAESAMPTVGAPTMVGPVSGFGTILINARFASRPTKSLAAYVDYINSELSKRYSVTSDGKPGIQDVRSAPKDSVLAFGAWKGAVREVVKADPPADGDYHLDTFMDELNEVVADALRVVAESRGWIYVRGTGR